MHELEFWFTHLVLCEFNSCTVLCLVSQSCLTIFDPIDCSLRGSYVHGGSPGKNTGVGGPSLLQGIFPTQESNQGLLHSRWILYQLSYQGSACESLYNLDLTWKWTQQGISCVESYCLLTTLLVHPSPSPFQGWFSVSSGTDLSVDLLPTYPVLFCGPSSVWSPLSVTRPDSIQGRSSS